MNTPFSHLYENCRLCPRYCGVDRTQGDVGVCQAPAAPKIARTMLHSWEEPCISGSRGSGTIFFAHCNLKCIFCQNHRISHAGQGFEITMEALADEMLQMQKQGAHNINLVSPTPYLPSLLASLTRAKQNGLKIPVVYNTNGYELPDMLMQLDGLVDVFLPDLKYYSTAVADALSHAADYYPIATTAIQTMFKLVGPPRFDSEGLLTRGLLIRHLVLPNYPDESRQILNWIRHELPPSVFISLMAQFIPAYRASTHPLLNRPLTQTEYDRIVDYCLDLGLENGFMQELSSADPQYVPEFGDSSSK